MILGVGTDIVRVARLEAGLARFGARYAQRILHSVEYGEFEAAARPGHFLAKRFAAKEAAAKALGTGFRGTFGLRDIRVAHDHLGCPRLILTGGAHARAAELGVKVMHMTLSDEADYAVAFVVCEGGQG
ncbi:holo-ACP synthase [Acidiferrobacter sp.]|uniref:holo-ACP synthase n=1 Tax=Acidiferrobacter sp. TaxID=1872107 RepID=UPI00260C29A1|nr:holo-ACP synthase [Acidiferrobacter sp.]